MRTALKHFILNFFFNNFYNCSHKNNHHQKQFNEKKQKSLTQKNQIPLLKTIKYKIPPPKNNLTKGNTKLPFTHQKPLSQAKATKHKILRKKSKFSIKHKISKKQSDHQTKISTKSQSDHQTKISTKSQSKPQRQRKSPTLKSIGLFIRFIKI